MLFEVICGHFRSNYSFKMVKLGDENGTEIDNKLILRKNGVIKVKDCYFIFSKSF